VTVVDSEPAGAPGLQALPPTGAYAWIHGRGLFGVGESARVEVGTGPERFERTVEGLKEHFARESDRIAFASFTFDERNQGSSVVIPEKLFVQERPSLDPSPFGDIDKIRYAGSSISEIEWLEVVDDAIRRIRGGVLDKVVLARDVHVWSKSPLDNRLLAARLARRFPECYTFIHGDLVGATPELLIRRTGHLLQSQVLAGTAARGSDPAGDESIGARLLASAKDAGEHRLAVESVSDVLARICSSVVVSARPELMKLANVQHLATTITGSLRQPWSALEVAGLLHPTAAVCGTPRHSALELIREVEGMDRGRYGGPVGWVDARGNGEFGIALRCAEVDGARARLFAGNGIVSESLPEDELEETRLKLRAMQSALET
jgi:menaquinone-specific isochorismate synthase